MILIQSMLGLVAFLGVGGYVMSAYNSREEMSKLLAVVAIALGFLGLLIK